MRKLIVTNIMSIDGYYEGPGSDVMALPMDHAFDLHNVERLRAADTLLLGRTTYDLFRGFWPEVVDNPEATPEQREISRRENAIDKVAVSDSIKADETDPWRDSTRIVRRADLHDEVTALKNGDGGDILTYGSRTMWHGLLAAGLVDEVHLMVGPAILGGGTPMFGTAPIALRLLSVRTFEGSDNILLRYTP